MAVTAVVLAGGESVRFGSDKLEFAIEKEPMLGRVVRVVREVADRVVISVRDPGSVARLTAIVGRSVAFLPDLPQLGGLGPGAGIVTAVDRCGADELLVVPGDMPWLTSTALRSFCQKAKALGATVGIPQWPDGEIEPVVQWQAAGAWAGRIGSLARGGAGVRPTDLVRGGDAAVLLPVTALSADRRCFASVNVRPDTELPSADWSDRDRASEPLALGPEARDAFWAAVRSTARGALVEATASYRREAGRYARLGVPRLEAHALGDALRCAREASIPAFRLEKRLEELRGPRGI